MMVGPHWVSVDELDPHDAFAKLADETRVDILRAVAEAEREGELDEATPRLSFKALYDRVDVSNSSRFAYHLDQLTGTFLHKNEDGYAFTWAGERIVRTILAGGYGTEIAFDPVALDGPCPACGASTLRAGPETTTICVRCRSCEGAIASYPLTPGLAANRDPAALVSAAERRIRSSYDDIFAGDCPKCGGRLRRSIRDAEPLPGDPYLSVSRCRECLAPYGLPVSFWALSHPATVAFYWTHDVDIRSTPFWELIAYLADGRWTVEGIEGGSAYRITLREADDELHLALDADLTVTDVTRLTSET
ncbi:helix-turn-helix domain-containing protein [Halovivax gelatinilyticus]|uniref:helix-turn-helix domain-containing protein n=1 Tax=Halovivax gelatinilyticus TaxID=2961597 RepID=UPI0020CA7B95|nr:helix-turn-helix domain-containing protein [Halovivax gelatinilyticus]